jgi:hypothetical protein
MLIESLRGCRHISRHRLCVERQWGDVVSLNALDLSQRTGRALRYCSVHVIAHAQHTHAVTPGVLEVDGDLRHCGTKRTETQYRCRTLPLRVTMSEKLLSNHLLLPSPKSMVRASAARVTGSASSITTTNSASSIV